MATFRERASGLFRRGWESITNRVGMWINSGLRAFNVGQIFAPTPAGEDEPRFMWKRGATENPCKDCESLDGQIKTASEWQKAGIEPQSPDLECGGWNCQCRFVAVA